MIKVTIGNNVSRNTVIIDENTTLRTAFENQKINYAIGTSSLDGYTLGPGELDKTFAELGVTTQCFLMNAVKADNAAKIKIVGGACVIESAATLEQLKTLEKHRPKALCLFEGDELDFAVGTCKGNGSIATFGVSFGETASNEKASVTVLMPAGVGDPKAWAAEVFGAQLMKLNKVEARFEAALSEAVDEMTVVLNSISVA